MPPKPRPMMDRIVHRSHEAPCLTKGLDLPCWVINSSGHEQGYGQVRQGGKTLYAHRVAYAELIESIPDRLEHDHLCRNHACWNPWHLEPVSHAENMRRGHPTRYRAALTHCVAGHLFDEANTYRPPGTNRRQCRKCKALRKREAIKR